MVLVLWSVWAWDGPLGWVCVAGWLVLRRWWVFDCGVLASVLPDGGYYGDWPLFFRGSAPFPAEGEPSGSPSDSPSFLSSGRERLRSPKDGVRCGCRSLPASYAHGVLPPRVVRYWCHRIHAGSASSGGRCARFARYAALPLRCAFSRVCCPIRSLGPSTVGTLGKERLAHRISLLLSRPNGSRPCWGRSLRSLSLATLDVARPSRACASIPVLRGAGSRPPPSCLAALGGGAGACVKSPRPCGYPHQKRVCVTPQSPVLTPPLRNG